MNNYIQILDTTLRDGMQTPGIGVNKRGRGRIAQAIARTGVDVMEIGFAANPLDYEWMPYVAKKVLETPNSIGTRTQIAGLARLVQQDIDCTRHVFEQARVPEARRRIHLYIAASSRLRTNGIRKSESEVCAMIDEHVAYARRCFPEGTVQFSPEDAGRIADEQDPGQYGFLRKSISVAHRAGADVINIPDTTGWCLPHLYGELIERLSKDIPEVRRWSAHVHNDDGQATAKTLYGIGGGATQIEGSVLGLGERAGNCDWMTVAANLYMKPQYYAADVRLDTPRFRKTAHDVAKIAGIPYPRNFPVVGRVAHMSSSGTHVAAICNDVETYHILPAKKFGGRQQVCLGQTSGAAAVRAECQRLEIPIRRPIKEVVYDINLFSAKNRGKITQHQLRKMVQ